MKLRNEVISQRDHHVHVMHTHGQTHMCTWRATLPDWKLRAWRGARGWQPGRAAVCSLVRPVCALLSLTTLSSEGTVAYMHPQVFLFFPFLFPQGKEVQ